MSDERTPFWKKEISFGRKVVEPAAARSELETELEEIKRAAIAAVAPEQLPQPESEPAAAESAPTTIDEDEWADEWTEPKVPFWQKQLGGKKQARPETPKAAQPAKAKRESTPFWKKELSVGRRSAPAKVNELDPVAAVVEESTPKAGRSDDARPFWRKELAIGRKRPQGAPKEKAAKPVVEADAPKQQGSGKFSMPKLQARPRKIKHDKSGRALPQAHKRLVGLKIGASQIAAARVSNNGSAELQQLARLDLEHGIVVGGELREPDKLADSLREFFKVNNLPRRGVRLGIANNRIGVRTFEIVGIDDPKQLDNAIRFRAQEALPIPIEDAVLDYQVLSEFKDVEGQTVKRVLLVVAYRDLVDRYVGACNKAGIELVGIDLEAFALLRAMSAPRAQNDPSDAAVVVVAIGHERSTFAVSDGRVCEFTRVLEWGGSALNVAIARSIDRAPSEAEPFKRALDLNASSAPQGMKEEQFEAVRDAVRKQIQSFARELVSSLQFYQNQPGSLGIGEIILTGGTAHLPGLADELQRLIGVVVRVGDPLARVRVSKKVYDEEQIGSLAVAIGLGIED